MPPKINKFEIEPDQFFQDLAFSLSEANASDSNVKNIVEFIETEIDHEKWGIELNVRQWAVLKAFYTLPLTDEELAVLECWRLGERTTWEPNKKYQSLVCECGRRGSKTTIISLVVAYEFYRLCHLPHPQKYYGIAASTPISILIIATSAAQAKRTIFKQSVGVMRCCKFFQPLIKRQLIFIGQEEIKYEEKLLYVFSGNSQSSGQVGQSAILLVMDEVARFQDTDGNSNALELWSNLGISGVTFGDDAKRVAISSAWYEGDAIQKLYKSSKTDPSWLGLRLRTWDLNVGATRDNPLIASEYNLNPTKAALEFEGIRTAAENAFFDANEVKRAFTGKSQIFVKTKRDQYTTLEIERIERANYMSAMHLDPSIIRDAYAIAFGHSETNKENQLIVVIDGLLAWEPQPEAPVSILNVQSLIKQIHSQRPIQKLTADHHNSAETLERLRLHGIPTESQYASNKLQLAQYECTRALLHENRLVLPSDSNFKNLLLDEMTRVQLIRGQKIKEPADFSKDMCDAICGVVYTLVGKPQSATTPMVLSTQTGKRDGFSAAIAQARYKFSSVIR
ncbi:hypothetical protein ACQ4M3_18955 [Leptolyngbya sp. AN03gr2]|uniref:hypothetical protein n=1 Tax=Leptolyngbya sp. AN03gr2 TaxID=3423364 RepID=UPI003D31C918